MKWNEHVRDEEIEHGGKNRAYRSVKKVMTANSFIGGKNGRQIFVDSDGNPGSDEEEQIEYESDSQEYDEDVDPNINNDQDVDREETDNEQPSCSVSHEKEGNDEAMEKEMVSETKENNLSITEETSRDKS